MSSEETHIQHAEVKMMQADFVEGHEREILLTEAKDDLLRAEHAAPGSGSWRLACIGARLGQEALCRKWLERARKAGTLLPRAELAKHHYFADVRDRPWFAALLRDLT
ncbi:MAG: hypothetical protein GWP08_07125 [Nitrospiraceae bacterium]|nr:hypothetical protein [Nitrospiraceae bacterium]